jgi:O-antigen/teichoic acid export membrane protein
VFALTLHVGTLLNFVIMNAAPLFIVRDLGLKDLGYFRAVVVLAQFVGWVPIVLDRLYYPTLCELVRNRRPVSPAYERFARIYLAAGSIVAAVLILFSRELLAIFGRAFSESGFALLQIMAGAALLSAPMMILNYALVTAHQKTVHTMVTYALGALAAIVLYGTLVPRFGLLGAGVSYLLVQLIMLGLSVILVRRFTDVAFPTRSYLMALCALVLAIFGSWFMPTVSAFHFLLKVGVVSAFVLVVVTLRLMTPKEIVELFQTISPVIEKKGAAS